jgi:glycosyltransferase involved in cell wall biosynthesis
MTKKTKQKNSKLKIGLVVPHIFMHRDILPHVIFSPAQLALSLADGLQRSGEEVFLFTPGPVDTKAANITADLSYFERELAGRGDTYLDLLKKHPFTFVTLARQVQSELIAKAYAMANRDELDIVHVYTNEEDIALPFAELCTKPIVFTHHDPFNFLVKYKNVFPKYKSLNWISMSYAQRRGMPTDTNWVGNVYHGLSDDSLRPVDKPSGNYIAYLGRIIEPKGLHLAIQAVKRYNATAKQPLKLKIVGKHYAGHKKDTYWQERILPELGNEIEHIGFIEPEAKRDFLANARAVIVPSIFDEPFGMVIIEAFACGTPVIGLDSGAIPEVVKHGETGVVVDKIFADDGQLDETATADKLAAAIGETPSINRANCRQDFETRLTAGRMCAEHLEIYEKLHSKA